MQIVKIKKETYTVTNVSPKPFFTWRRFKEVRESRNLNTSRYAKCFNCEHSFDLDESFYVAAITKVGNRAFCKACADQFNKSKTV